MELVFDRRHIIAMVFGVVFLVLDFVFFLRTAWFIPLIIVGLSIGWSQFWIDFFVNSRRQKELEAIGYA